MKQNYDAVGNVNSDAGSDNSYLYDGEGRICAVSSSSALGSPVMTAYVYDAEGNRVAKGMLSSWPTNGLCPNLSPGGVFTPTNSYVLGPSGEELSQTDGYGNWTRSNVYAAGMLVATYDIAPTGDPALHFQLTDWLGTRRAQTDIAGNPEEYFASLPFGDSASSTVASGAPSTTDDSTPLHFTGKERDTESGNDYFGARYYNSAMGRFTSPDQPFVDQHPDNPQSWNLYAYARNNPLIMLDPSGLDCVYANDAGDDVESIDHNSNSGECGGAGGTWVPGYVNEQWATFNDNTGMFQVASLDGNQVDYSQFEAGSLTRNDGFCATSTGCGANADFSQANAGWLQSMIAGNGHFFSMMEFMAGRQQPLSGGILNLLASGPLDLSSDHWAGPGGMGAPGGQGDWAAMVHDYNFWDWNGGHGSDPITLGSYFSLSNSPAKAQALIQADNNLIRNAGGVQSVKMGLFFGVVNAFQWAAHAF